MGLVVLPWLLCGWRMMEGGGKCGKTVVFGVDCWRSSTLEESSVTSRSSRNLSMPILHPFRHSHRPHIPAAAAATTTRMKMAEGIPLVLDFAFLHPPHYSLFTHLPFISSLSIGFTLFTHETRFLSPSLHCLHGRNLIPFSSFHFHLGRKSLRRRRRPSRKWKKELKSLPFTVIQHTRTTLQKFLPLTSSFCSKVTSRKGGRENQVHGTNQPLHFHLQAEFSQATPKYFNQSETQSGRALNSNPNLQQCQCQRDSIWNRIHGSAIWTSFIISPLKEVDPSTLCMSGSTHSGQHFPLCHYLESLQLDRFVKPALVV